MAQNVTFVDEREWGDRKNEILRNSRDYTPAKADEVLHSRGIYKDIRSKDEKDKGVKPEAKYPELSAPAK